MRANLKVHKKQGSTPVAVYFGRTHNLFNPSEAYTTALSWWDHIKHYGDYVIPQLNEKMSRYFDNQEHESNKNHAQDVIGMSRTSSSKSESKVRLV